MALTVEISWTSNALIMFAFPSHAFLSPEIGLLDGKLFVTGSYNATELLLLEVSLLSKHVIINDRPKSLAQTGQIYDSRDSQQYPFITTVSVVATIFYSKYRNPRHIFMLQLKLPFKLILCSLANLR